ncbi:hypothetical protein [Exiguobacterium sp. s57]|uniref:hypothetical protein n=1 Tax=Exiguobacterium sp. s57 TaxID=2751258 RepID=UPI001BEBC837|nr:hypothetical protein [Exiguobacterium sp. s57]
MSWPEDPKLALLESKKHYTANGDKTVYEVTREELREVKRMLIERQEQRVIEADSPTIKPMKVHIRFSDLTDPLYVELTQAAKKEHVSEDEIIRRALNKYLNES